jgi:hypothetical protein
LFATDNVAGVLVWEARESNNNNDGIWTDQGVPKSTFNLVKTYMNVIWENRDFLSKYHGSYNSDGFTFTDDTFQESDPAVLTRRLGSYVVVYSLGPTQVVLSNTGGRQLTTVSSDPAAGIPSITGASSQITIVGLSPNRVYIFATQ